MSNSTERRPTTSYIFPLEPFVMADSFERMWNLLEGSLEPLGEVRELEKTVRVTVDLPLVRKKDIKVRLVGDILEIYAELKRCVTFNKWGTIQKKCEFRSFHKSLRLPTKVTTIGAKATFKKGVLVVELPKAEETHEVEIQ
ncbi:MAG: Hsp20/alpha crystallin family protein [Candidatus Bathyarchaeia archaeon]